MLQRSGVILNKWNKKMARDAFRRSRLRRDRHGDGDPHAYTPKAEFRYQWEDCPTWEKVYHFGMYSAFLGFTSWVIWARFEVDPEDWSQSEANRRQQMKKEAVEMMAIKPAHRDVDDGRDL